MRAGIPLIIGAAIGLLGLLLIVGALLWLASNSGFDEYAFDSENPMYGRFWTARFGISVGIFPLLVGLGIVIGFARRARMP